MRHETLNYSGEALAVCFNFISWHFYGSISASPQGHDSQASLCARCMSVFRQHAVVCLFEASEVIRISQPSSTWWPHCFLNDVTAASLLMSWVGGTLLDFSCLSFETGNGIDLDHFCVCVCVLIFARGVFVFGCIPISEFAEELCKVWFFFFSIIWNKIEVFIFKMISVINQNNAVHHLRGIAYGPTDVSVCISNPYLQNGWSRFYNGHPFNLRA